MELERIVNRIDKRLAAVGLKAARASIEAGLSDSAIRNLRRSVEKGGKGAQTRTLTALAPVLKTSVQWLMEGTGPEEIDAPNAVELPIEGLPVLGQIQAGAWLDTTLFDDGGEREMLPVVRDLRFPHARQYCLRIAGDSVDLLYPDGSYVTCVDFADSGLPIREGLRVHVERQRGGGQLIEITIKELHQIDGAWFLMPRSTNPRHQPIPLDEQGEDAEVIIRGVVIAKYEREPL